MIEGILRLHLQDPTLRFISAKEFSSANLIYRQRIRQVIASKIEAQGETLAHVLDLSKPLLKVGEVYVSISHCPTVGGFVLSKKPIGFDLETEGRLRSATILRVSQPLELEKSPSAGALWTAKEATFKALQHAEKKPELLSQIEIGTWDVEPSSTSGTFKAMNLSAFSSHRALGCFIGDQGFILSAFALSA